MELKQLRQKSAYELKAHLLDLQKRREIARVNTLLGQQK